MGFKDHEKVSAEDLAMLEPLLTDYYKKPYEESYQILRKKIEAKFRGKDTNSWYVSMLFDDLEDLIMTVILRLISINGKSLNQRGEKIRDLELMVGKIVNFVYQEELKRIRRHLNEQPINEGDSESKTPSLPHSVDNETRAIKKEIAENCYDGCVQSLPDDARDLFRAYYPRASHTPQELTALRKRLANEAAGLTQAQAHDQTPEQELRTLNNLQSKVNKWKKSSVEGCVKKCVEQAVARHPRLNYLSQQ